MNSPPKIKVDADVKPLEAAKWFQLPILMSVQELEELINELKPFFIVKTLSKIDEPIIPVNDFISLYKEYVDALAKGEFPDQKCFRGPFSSVITNDIDALFALSISSSQVIKVKKPIIQMQYHTMTWSKEEGKFRSQLFGKDSIPWGLLFSYPQIILDPSTKEIVKADQPEMTNSILFKKIRIWQRENTVPTPFLVGDQTINASQRLGKGCFPWINNHPSLRELNILVKGGGFAR